MARKTVPLNLRADELFKRRLDKAAEVLDVPAAQLVREGVNEKLQKEAKRNSRLAQALSALEAA
jgi:hypothetical protein